MKKRKLTMYMRQFMQLLMALIFIVPSAVNASDMMLGGNLSNVPLAEKQDTKGGRTVIGTVYDAATNLPMSGVRVQATGHASVTTMTNAEGKYKLQIPEYVTLEYSESMDHTLDGLVYQRHFSW